MFHCLTVCTKYSNTTSTLSHILLTERFEYISLAERCFEEETEDGGGSNYWTHNLFLDVGKGRISVKRCESEKENSVINPKVPLIASRKG